MAQKRRVLCRCSTTRRAGLPCRLEAARPHERGDVVQVGDVGPQPGYRRRDILLVAPAAQQRHSGSGARGLGRAPLEKGVTHPGSPQRPQLQLDRALLPALDAIAVVND